MLIRQAQKDAYLFCLLENDNLITDVRVATDRLLTPYTPAPGPGASHPETHVHLVINVKVRPATVIYGNLSFL